MDPLELTARNVSAALRELCNAHNSAQIFEGSRKIRDRTGDMIGNLRAIQAELAERQQAARGPAKHP